MPSCSDAFQSRATRVCLGVLFALGVLLMIILLPISISKIEYYEYGLKHRATSGFVDTDQVYKNGRYLLGPTYNFIKYPADALYEHFEELSVFSSGNSNASVGLEFRIDIDFTYFLIPEELGDLHVELANSYRAVIAARAKDAIKNSAIFVSFTEYFRDRAAVEARFRQAVADRWKAPPSVHARLDQFHLGRIRIPESVAEKQLESRLQTERNDREAYLQQAQRERDLTAVQVHQIGLEKDIVLRTARAEASLERSKAASQATQMDQQAAVNGTALLFAATGIVSEEQKAAYMYIRTLQHHKNLDLDINYLPGEAIVPATIV